jgi:hypothetical protein
MKILNKSWFALVITMMLVIVILLMALVVLEIAIPFSRNIKWIENSSNAYYQANSWVEWAMWFVSQNNVWSQNTKNYWTTSIDNKYDIVAVWWISPTPSKWNSDFDKNWSKVSQWNPIQMEVWNNVINFTTPPKAYFRVPLLNSSSSLTLSWWSSLPIISWQLSWKDKTLNATWSYLMAEKVCNSFENDSLCW